MVQAHVVMRSGGLDDDGSLEGLTRMMAPARETSENLDGTPTTLRQLRRRPAAAAAAKDLARLPDADRGADLTLPTFMLDRAAVAPIVLDERQGAVVCAVGYQRCCLLVSHQRHHNRALI
eukprot:3940927-Prymnesium_polylepis.1